MENMKSILLAVFCAGVLVSCDDERPDFKEHEVVPPPVATSELAGGADISSVTEFESKGVRFYNKDGVYGSYETAWDECHPVARVGQSQGRVLRQV